MGRGQGYADRFLAPLQGPGGRCHCDHRAAGQGRCQGAGESVRGAVAGEAFAGGDWCGRIVTKFGTPYRGA